MASYVGDLGGNTLPPDVLGGNAVDALVGQRITTGADNVTVLVIAQPSAAIEEITSLAERATDHLTRLKPDDAVMVLEQHEILPRLCPPSTRCRGSPACPTARGGRSPRSPKPRPRSTCPAAEPSEPRGTRRTTPPPNPAIAITPRLSQRVDFFSSERAKIFDRAIFAIPRLSRDTTPSFFVVSYHIIFSRSARAPRARLPDALRELTPTLTPTLALLSRLPPETRKTLRRWPPRGARHRPAVHLGGRGREGGARRRLPHRGGAETPQAAAEGFRVRRGGARGARRRAARVRQREARHVVPRNVVVQPGGAEVAARVRAVQAGHRREVHRAEGR